MCLVGKPGRAHLVGGRVAGCVELGIPGHHGVPEALGQCMDCIGGVAAAALLGDVVPQAHHLGPTPPPIKWPGAGGRGGRGHDQGLFKLKVTSLIPVCVISVAGYAWVRYGRKTARVLTPSLAFAFALAWSRARRGERARACGKMACELH